MRKKMRRWIIHEKVKLYLQVISNVSKEYIGRYIDINPLSFVCCPMQSHYVNKNKNKPFIMNFIGRGLILNITILIK